MPVYIPIEWAVGVRLINNFLLDARRKNIVGALYTDTAELLVENIEAVRTEGQLYYVDDGAGNTQIWWFNGGTTDGHLEQLYWRGDDQGFVQQAAAFNAGANFEFGYKILAYLSNNLGADSFDFQHNYHGGGDTSMGVPGIGSLGFGYDNLVDGTVNIGTGSNGLLDADTGWSRTHGAGNEITGLSIYSVADGFENKVHADLGPNLKRIMHAVGQSNDVRNGFGMAYGSYITMDDGVTFAVGVAGAHNLDMGFKVGTAVLETDVDGNIIGVVAGTEDRNGLVTWRDGTNEAPESTNALIDSRGAKALITLEYLTSYVSGSNIILITYAALKALRDGSTLVPGQEYQITDYKTVYTQVQSLIVSNSAQGITDGLDTAVEPIIVTAITDSTLHPTALSTIYEDDTLHYDIDRDLTEGAGTGMTGAIIYRKDLIRNIEASFDWRAFKFRRYKTSADDWLIGGAYGRLSVVTTDGGTNVWISLITGNTGLDPTISPEAWELFYTVGAFGTPVLIEYLGMIRDDATVYGLNIDNSTFVDMYFLANSLDLNDSSGLAGTCADISVLASSDNVVEVNRYDGNVVLQVDPTFSKPTMSDIVIHGASTSITIISNLYVTEINLSSALTAVKNTTILGTTQSLSVQGGSIEDSFLFGLYGVNSYGTRGAIVISPGLGFAENSILIGNIGIVNSVVSGKGVTMGGGLLDINFSAIAPTVLVAQFFNLQADNLLIRTSKKVSFIRSTIMTGTSIIGAGAAENCYIPKIGASTIEGTLTDVRSLGEWVAVDIPANVTLTDVVFTIAKWSGFNTWSGGAVNLNGIKVSKRYYDEVTLEKLWWDDVDVNGGTNLIELK